MIENLILPCLRTDYSSIILSGYTYFAVVVVVALRMQE